MLLRCHKRGVMRPGSTHFMAITSKIRIARGLKANLPAPPSSFEIGRPYYCTDTNELFVGAGIGSAMTPVGAAADPTSVFQRTGAIAANGNLTPPSGPMNLSAAVNNQASLTGGFGGSLVIDNAVPGYTLDDGQGQTI
jgi:hypothetical protein